MNGYALFPKDRNEDVKFSTHVADSTLEEIGLEEIMEHFNVRIELFKRHSEKRIASYLIECPGCGMQHTIHSRHCSCGLILSEVLVKNKGILRDYEFHYRGIELDIIARKFRR